MTTSVCLPVCPCLYCLNIYIDPFGNISNIGAWKSMANKIMQCSSTGALLRDVLLLSEDRPGDIWVESHGYHHRGQALLQSALIGKLLLLGKLIKNCRSIVMACCAQFTERFLFQMPTIIFSLVSSRAIVNCWSACSCCFWQYVSDSCLSNDNFWHYAVARYTSSAVLFVFLDLSQWCCLRSLLAVQILGLSLSRPTPFSTLVH